MEHHTSAFFCSEITEEILKMREKYPVKYYCPLSRESQDMLRAGGWHAACPVYGETFRYLLFERGWRPEAAEDFLEQLVNVLLWDIRKKNILHGSVRLWLNTSSR